MKKKILLAVSVLAVTSLVVEMSNYNRVMAVVPYVNERVSINNTGDGQGGNDHSPVSNENYNISANGRFVVFASRSSNLVSDDTNGVADIFMRDVENNTTTRVSVSASGVQANDESGWGGPAISQTGRYVAFSSQATNLIDGQTISSTDKQVYLRDTLTNTVSLVTQKTDGTLGNANIVSVQAVSNDGRFVLWAGQKNTNLNPNGSVNAGVTHLYLTDLHTRTFILLSPSDGSGSTSLTHYTMNCDGSMTVFATDAQLDANDTNSLHDIYLVDMRNGIKFKNLTAGATDDSIRPSISCNGDFVTFASGHSFDTQVPTGDTHDHLYLYSRINETMSVVDTTSTGVLGNNYASGLAGVDDKGNVVFSSGSTNFGSTRSQFYLKNKASGSLEMVSVTAYGSPSNGAGGKASISADGKRVVYGVGPLPNSLFAPTITSWQNYDTNGKSDIVMSLTGL